MEELKYEVEGVEERCGQVDGSAGVEGWGYRGKSGKCELLKL